MTKFINVVIVIFWASPVKCHIYFIKMYEVLISKLNMKLKLIFFFFLYDYVAPHSFPLLIKCAR